MPPHFEKVLAQVASVDNDMHSDRIALESRAQKIRRLEELIRAKEATGDRIVISLAAALVVSAMALPVYATFYSNGYAYLPDIGGSISSVTSFIAKHPSNSLLAARSTSVQDAVEIDVSQVEKTVEYRPRRPEPSFERYMIHRASESAALIEGPSGLWWVKPGMRIPGAGQILSIEHSETGWAVITSETTITEVREARILR